MRFGFDEEVAIGAGVSRSDQRPMLGLDCDGMSAAGQPDPLRDVCDNADVRELPLMAWHEHDLLVLADGDGQGDAHAREHDRVVESDKSKRAHEYQLPIYLRLRSMCSSRRARLPAPA